MTTKRTTPFTPEEIESMPPLAQQIVKDLGGVWNSYCKLRIQDPSQIQAFCDALHQCQDLILEQTGVPGRR